jgi:hypothetical protein
MEKVPKNSGLPQLDSLVFVYYRLVIPTLLVAVLVTGHLWGLPEGLRELLIYILGLCIDLKGMKEGK